MMYPEIEKYFEKDKFHLKDYRTDVLNYIDGIYKQLSGDRDIHNWCRCKDNTYEDLYDAFIKKVENIITPTGQDIIHSKEFFMYNFLHNDSFYTIWTNDVLRLLIKMKRGKI